MESLKDEIQGFQEEKDEFETQLVKLRSVVDEKKSEVELFLMLMKAVIIVIESCSYHYK